MHKRDIIYWTLVIILNYLPTIGFHYIVRPMWYKGVESFTSATTIEMGFTIIFLPIYLLVANYLMAKKFDKANGILLLNAIIVLTCIFISTELHLKNWTNSIGSENPDSETIGVMNFERTVGIIISLIGFTIILLRLRNKSKTATIRSTE